MEDKEKRLSLAKELLGSIGLLLLSIYVMIECIRMPYPDKFIIGPGFFPFLCGALLFICAAVYCAQMLKKGARFADIGGVLASIVTNKSSLMILLALGIIAIYIFIGVKMVSFYASTFLLILVIGLLYVKRWKIWQLLAVDVGVTLFIWLVFFKLFNVRLF